MADYNPFDASAQALGLHLAPGQHVDTHPDNGLLGGVKNFLFGGGATAGINPQGQYGQYAGNYLQNALNANRGPGLDFGQYNQDRGQMGYLASQLQGVSTGQQKGAGELAVERQMGNAIAAQQAAARMARGANAALAFRQAARNQADLGVNAAGQAQIAALQDQANARGQLAGLLGQMQQGSLAQQGMGLDAYKAQNAVNQGYLGQLLGLNQSGVQNQLGLAGINMQDKGVMPYLLQGAGGILASYVGQK